MKKLRVDHAAILLERPHGAARTWLPPLVVLGMLTTAVSCTTTFLNVGYCATTNGDVFCANRHTDDGRLYCIWGNRQCRDQLANEYLDEEGEDFDGCIAAPPPSGGDECYSPCGGGPEFQEDGLGCPAAAGTTGTATESDGEMSAGTSGAMTSTSATGTSADGTAGTSSGCVVPGDCEGDPGGPFCDEMSGACVTCDVLEGDVTCAGVDMLHPLCVEGACVACTAEQDEVCTNGGQVCDAEANECVDCKVHEDCGDDWACHIFEGTCFPETSEVFMISDGAHDIAADIAGVRAGGFAIVLLDALDGTTPYDDTSTILVDNGKTVAILGNYGNPRPLIHHPSDPAEVVSVDGDATLYLQGIEISEHGNTSTPLKCTGPGARLDARGTIITANERGSLLDHCEARLENCFLQSLDNGRTALSISGESNVEIICTSLVTHAGGAGSDGGTNAVLSCANDGAVLLRNSLLLSMGGGAEDPEINNACTSFVLEHSIIESAPVFGLGNGTLEPPITGTDYTRWFVGFDAGNLRLDDNYINNELEAVSSSIAHLQIAVPLEGDSPLDIDGEDRSMSAYPGMVGADAP